MAAIISTAARAGLWARLERKGVDRVRIAREVAGKPGLLDDVMLGLDSDRAPVKFGCGKVLRVLAEENPELLYPKFRTFVDLLDSDSKIMRWEGIHVIGRLAAVDTRGKIARVLDRYLEPIRGPVLITAANAIGGAGHIAAHKPKLAAKITAALLGVGRARYQTSECRNIAIGGVITAFDEFFDHVEGKPTVIRFVRRQLGNKRPSTRKKAERFLAKWG